MNVLIRADASVDIGSGHIMRCLTLADRLLAAGGRVWFACRDQPGAMAAAIRQRNFPLIPLHVDPFNKVEDAHATKRAMQAVAPPGGFDWLVVDHYGLDASWEVSMRPLARKILVIDDLADRRHDCDLLLDQNFYADFASRYIGLVPDAARCLLGPSYVLLRPEFARLRRTLRPRTGAVRRILVSFGGTDPTNETERVLQALEVLQPAEFVADVVVGSANPNRQRIRSGCDRRPWATFYCQVSNMAEMMAAADLGIGAGGSAMWERCAVGLPTLTVVVAENQLRTTRDVAARGAIAYLGADELTAAAYAAAIRNWLKHPAGLACVSREALDLVDPCQEGAKSIVQTMSELLDAKENC